MPLVQVLPLIQQADDNREPSKTSLMDSLPAATSHSRRPVDDRDVSIRNPDSKQHKTRGEVEDLQVDDDPRYYDPERVLEDSTSATAAAARAPRRGPSSPEVPLTSASSREARAFQSPTDVQGKSPVNLGLHTSSTQLVQEGGEVIKRVIVDDPQVDLTREKDRIAEAIPLSPEMNSTPISSIGGRGAEGGDDGSKNAGRTRQDHSASASRRKETKFGDYVLGQTLGEGEFGKVKLGWKKDGSVSSVQVAIKLIRRENLSNNPTRLPKIYREIKILSQLSHPNIVRLHEMVETDRYIGIILEYASGGELFDYILTHRYLKDNAARKLFAQLVSGVGYLHKKGIVHRDLKLENLLLDRNRNIIITDFGFANTFNPRDELGEDIEYNLTNRDFVKKMDLERLNGDGFRRGDLMQTSCGSPCYAAPELVVTDSLYTGRKVDVWSCGVILYAMLAGYLPFDDDPANPEGDNINLLYKYIMSTPLTFPEYVTPHARDLLRRILVPDPRKRADLFEVARHSWLSDYAHVVAHVTSSTTTLGEIANTTVTSEISDTPLLARSASVREPTKPHASNMSPVGGLSHQGKIDPQQSDKSAKAPRDPKRRTVQVEYVAPQSQTLRGELSPPPPQQRKTVEPSSAMQSKEQDRADTQFPTETNRRVSAVAAARKPLPQDPPVSRDSRNQESLAGISNSRTAQRPVTSQPAMQPPARPIRDPPRSVSDSMNAFGQMPSSSTARPTTGGSMASTGGRLPSRGNSYSQVLGPTVVATNAQGKLAQPKNGRQYNISAPISQAEPYLSDPSIGLPSSQRLPPRYSQVPPPRDEPVKSHKRSSTLSNMFGRSGSFFSGKSQPQSPLEQGRPQEKRYPPTSMKGPISNSPRQSTDSRRPSFSFSRKNSEDKGDKNRRFSLIPASFSFKSMTGGPKEQASDASRPMSQRQQSFNQHPTAQSVAYGRGGGQTDSEESIPTYDGGTGNNRNVSAPLSRRTDNVARNTRKPEGLQQTQYGSPQYSSPPMNSQNRPLPQGQSYFINDTAMPTDSELSVAQAQNRPRYPAGFNSPDEEPRASMQSGRNGRGPGVLQKPNRKFADAYDQDPGHHAGSSGAAKRVMDFFRRRGRSRAGEDR
ncbi:hypothetical protein MMC13_002542 [Lambiella insularis]|nr:hypothetical protein [Lambiella insularis]